MPVFQVTVAQRRATHDHQHETQRLFFLRGKALTNPQVARISRTLLADPVTESWTIDQATAPGAAHTIEITFLPGVTDSVAENLVRAAEELGIPELEEAASGMRVIVHDAASPERLHQLARNRYVNEVIQRFAIDQPIPAPFSAFVSSDSDRVETIVLSGADDDALLAISRLRRLSLDLNEMRAIRDYYRGEAREPTDVELETLAQTWSEHCVHKTFKALIDVDGATIDGLLRTYIRAATEKINKPWVKSAFVDNAGIIAFNARWDLAFKVETHNHPSALEPFGGANTGIGGVIRDVLGVSALPIANTDVLCFGPLERTDVPAGVLTPRRVHDGVVKGIEDYGNKMGIPTVNGAVLFHEGYTANPLVFAGCVGLRPAAPAARPASAEAGDLIIVIGGRTGRDGLRGATFSSMEMGAETGGIASASVQIGHPIHEKQTQEAILQARDAGLYRAITDCGAGGFSSAIGEMASGLGATVQLDRALLKYPGLQPWEIWLSEAQERMVLAVPAGNWPAFKAICDGQDIPAFALGVFEASGRLTLKFAERIVGNLSIHFLHEGIPQRRLSADTVARTAGGAARAQARPKPGDATPELLTLLAHPNIRSKEDIVRVFDHEVKGATAVKPFVGVANHGPGDAAVLAPDPTSTQGLSLSNGICPQYGERDPYAMAWAAVDEAIRNAVAVGADPDRIAILDNFCWGNPNLPDRLGGLVACAQGCHDAALAYGAPFISGKDSLNNEYVGADGAKHAIPGTLLISALGIVPDVTATVTMDLKQAGNALYLVGDTRDELGMSHYAGLRRGEHADAIVPQPVPGALRRLRALHGAIRAGHARACHDCSEGGLAVALAEMCLAGRLGASVALAALRADSDDDIVLLFSESACRFIVEVAPDQAGAFERALSGTPCARIGEVTRSRTLVVTGQRNARVIDADIAGLERAWRGAIAPEPASVQHIAVSPARLSAPNIASGKRVLILHANGSNRDHDAALAVELAGGLPEIVHVNQLRARARALADYHMLILPGGFSYGDDLGAGVLWALDLRERLGESLQAFVAAGRPVLGICNGFQALMKAGLFDAGLFDAGLSDAVLLESGERAITLTYNERGHFECRWVMIEPDPDCVSVFTRGLREPIYCPIAHGEGRLMTRNEETLSRLVSRGMVALRYQGEGYPHNPNGSAGGIAGLSNAQGNVLGLMPHPENHIFPWQHPRWHRGEAGLGGLSLFANGLRNA